MTNARDTHEADPIEISVVAPMHNEEGCVEEFLRRTDAALRDMGVAHEMIIVSDGSTDRTNDLLRAGVEIVEYHRSFLHAKVAVIDDWATVGSSNIDPFSLLLAREANVLVFDPEFAATLRERVLASMAEGGRPVRADEHARRSWLQRLRGGFATWMLRLGVRVSGYRQRY